MKKAFRVLLASVLAFASVSLGQNLPTCGAPPPPPTGLRLTVVNPYRVQIHVDHVTGTQVGFRERRSLMPNGVEQVITSGYPDGQYVDATRLIPGQQFCWDIVAYDACGQESEEVIGELTLPAAPYPNTAPPPVPTNLRASVSSGKVVLTWINGAFTEPDGTPQTIGIQKSTSPSGPWTTPTVKQGQTWTDSNVVHGRTYYYRVFAQNPFRWSQSAYTAPVAVTP